MGIRSTKKVLLFDLMFYLHPKKNFKKHPPKVTIAESIENLVLGLFLLQYLYLDINGVENQKKFRRVLLRVHK